MPRRNRALDRAAAAGTRWGGHPPAGRREHRVRFWEAIARGASSENAAVEAGVLPGIGVRWFRKGGGMPPLTLAPASGRTLNALPGSRPLLSALSSSGSLAAMNLQRAPIPQFEECARWARKAFATLGSRFANRREVPGGFPLAQSARLVRGPATAARRRDREWIERVRACDWRLDGFDAVRHRA